MNDHKGEYLREKWKNWRRCNHEYRGCQKEEYLMIFGKGKGHNRDTLQPISKLLDFKIVQEEKIVLSLYLRDFHGKIT